MPDLSPTSLLSQSTFRAGLLQSQAYRVLSSFMNKELSPFQLSLSEWSVVGILSESPVPMRALDIARQLAISQPGCTVLIHGLLDKKLITRKDDANDGRAVAVELSEAGKKLSHTVNTHMRRQMRLFLHDVDRVDLALYLKVLIQIAAKQDQL